MRLVFLILIICCWCSVKDGEKWREHTCISSKKLSKKLLFIYSRWSINTQEERKLFTVISILKECCSLFVVNKYTRGRKVVHCDQ